MDQVTRTNVDVQSPLEAALAYAAIGLSVVPVAARGKRPLNPHGARGASPDPVVIRRWWDHWPDAGVGIATGPVSGVVVIDVDQKPGVDGEDTLSEYGASLPKTWQALTGGGGRHVYFRSPSEKIGCSPLGLGVDVRGDGGFVVAPPTMHVSGRRYCWDVDHHPDETILADMPPWLVTALSVRGRSTSRSRKNGKPAIEIQQGERNTTLFSLAVSMRNRGMTSEAILAALLAENEIRCNPPLDRREIEHIAAPRTLHGPTATPAGAQIISADMLGAIPLADAPIARVGWLWEGRIPVASLSLIEGPPGVGKSTVALDLAARVSTGSPFPGDQIVSTKKVGRSVLFYSAEDSIAETIRARAVAAGADLRLLCVAGAGARMPCLPGDIHLLETEIRQRDVALVILDPLTAFFDGDINLNNDQSVRTALTPLVAVAARTGVAVVGIRHLAKGGNATALYRGIGSVGIVASARSVLLVAREPRGDGRYVLAMTKSNVGKLAGSIVYRLVEDAAQGAGRIEWEGRSPLSADELLDGVDGETGTTAMMEAQSYLMDTLGAGPKPGGEVFRGSRGSGFSDRTIRRAKAALGVVSKKMGQAGPWVWQLPEDGH